MGLVVPEIEKRLVGRGLTPTEAEAAVMDYFSGKAREQFGSIAANDRNQLMHRMFSGVIALVAVILAYMYGEGRSVAKTIGWMGLPLACIWLSEEVGRRFATPPALVRWVAWVPLLAICGYRIVLLTI